MAYEKTIQELDRLRNQKDMELGFKVIRANVASQLNEIAEAKEAAIDACRTVDELKETEEAIRLESFMRRKDAERVKKDRAELSEQVDVILKKEHASAMNDYLNLSKEYNEKLSKAQDKIKAIADKTTAELEPIIKELAEIEQANDYVFNSHGVVSYAKGLSEFVDIDKKIIPISKVDTEREMINASPLKVNDMSSMKQSLEYPYSNLEKQGQSLLKRILKGIF